MLESVVAYGIIAGARAITGLRSLWLGTTPIPKQRIYYANHSSHGDFVLLWASLPPEVRRRTRPVAGADYWNKAGLRSYVINKVFNGVLVDRQRSEANANPLEPLDRALDGGDSLIIFPEGTRNLDDEVKLLPFKSGIYHLSLAHPDVEAGAGLAGQPQPGHAQGPHAAVAAALHPELRQAAGRHGGRRQGGVPRTSAHGPAGPGAGRGGLR